ncbi:CPBP family intramembrane glutamic endopeptidase [Thermodesulfobacteriota bacterium]
MKASATVDIFFRSVMGWVVAALFGGGSALIVRLGGLPNYFAAWMTVGIFGLIGGIFHALLIKMVGGRTSWKEVLLLSIVWALTLIASVTPLFLTSGPPAQMAMLTFYCFAIFGALGGTATVYLQKSLLGKAFASDVLPCVLIWSLSLGIAATATNTIGDGLQTLLPAVIALPLAFGILALIIGVGGGYSVVYCLSAKKKNRQPAPSRRAGDSESSAEKNRSYIVLLILLALPFYLNDFSSIYITDWRWWVFIDYTSVKLFPFLIVFWVIRKKRMNPAEFGLTLQPLMPFVTVVIIGALGGTLIDQNLYPILKKVPGYPPLGGMPLIESPLWNWIDLTFGLLLVGIFEELVFRAYLHTVVTRYTQHPLVIIGISAIAFGLIHWNGGFHQVLVTAFAGALFMVLYLRTLSVPAIMLAHFIVNFIDFAGVIPNSIFSYI